MLWKNKADMGTAGFLQTSSLSTCTRNNIIKCLPVSVQSGISHDLLISFKKNAVDKPDLFASFIQ